MAKRNTYRTARRSARKASTSVIAWIGVGAMAVMVALAGGAILGAIAFNAATNLGMI